MTFFGFVEPTIYGVTEIEAELRETNIVDVGPEIMLRFCDRDRGHNAVMFIGFTPRQREYARRLANAINAAGQDEGEAAAPIVVAAE